MTKLTALRKYKGTQYCDKDEQTKSHHGNEAMDNKEWDPNLIENPRDPKKFFQPGLPNVDAVIAKVKWVTLDISSSDNGLSKEDRMKKMGEYAKMPLNSPPNPETHSIQKEHIHVESQDFVLALYECKW